MGGRNLSKCLIKLKKATFINHVYVPLEDDDPGTEDDLSLLLDSSEEPHGETGESNTRLTALRRSLISQLLERLDQAEAVGGLRSICYLQVHIWWGVH